MKKTRMGILSIALMGLMLMSGCAKEEPVAVTPTPTPTPTVTATPTPVAAVTAEPTEEPTPTPEPEPTIPAGMMVSYLTGELVEESVGQKRPFAVMINNHSDAVPHSGLQKADLLYELEVEGMITRLMAVFQDMGDLQKIGPVRSLRHSYMDFANDNQAWIVHCGASNIAYDRTYAEGLPTIDGMVDWAFYRTDDRYAPHNLYIGADGIRSMAEEKGMNLSYPEGYQPNLLFHEEDTDLTGGSPANTVYVNFSWDNPVFYYNTESKTYERYEFGYAHADQETGEVLRFKNIIVQYVNVWGPIDDSGHVDMDLYTEGTGKYFTNGQCIDITWKKSGHDDATHYFDSAGNPLKLNPGKTMFEVIRPDWGVTYE